MDSGTSVRTVSAGALAAKAFAGFAADTCPVPSSEMDDGSASRIAELERELERLRQVLDLVPSFLYVIDEDGRYRMANKATLDSLRQTPESILKVKFHEITANRDQGEQLLARARTLMARGEAAVSSDVPFLMHDGRSLILKLHEVPFIDDVTGRRWLLGIATDRTPEVSLEEERLERAKLDRDLDLAREIQQGLFPSGPPDRAGFQFAGWNSPADATGGDFYDWFVSPNGTTYAVLGDVTGHGIGPALIASMTRAYARAVFREDAPLHVLLARLNDMLGAELPSGFFVTLAALAIGPDRDDLVAFASAGHGPSFHRTSDSVSEIGSHGPPLGVVPGVEFEAAEALSLDAGDVFVMASDGYQERRDSSGRQLGTEPLLRVCAQPASDAETIITSINRTVEQHAGSTSQDDDMTAVVVMRSIRESTNTSSKR